MEAQWIWLNEKEQNDDTYIGFKASFKASDNVTLRVSCDSIFAAYINGELALFSGCADYPHYKLYDEKNVSELCKGENELYVIVWYHGADTQTYYKSEPGLWFEVCQNGKPVLVSDESTLSRTERNFKQGYCKWITSQLGFSFYYDNSFDNTDPYLPAKRISKMQPSLRPQKPLVLDGRVPASYTNKDNHILVDFGREVAGYLDLDFESPIEQELLITYGEHLEIGKVSREIDGRDFSVEFKARKGKNKWFIPLRRLACRYLEVYFDQPLDVSYIGLQHVYYPVTERKKSFDDELLERIYDVSVRTLRLCMHEHYEDCPWREQALYALDSRNQMLFGYHAFEEKEYQRSNLLLINQGLRPDGLLSICFPASRDNPIPFFSLAYILGVCEYARYADDYSIFDDTRATISTIINTFDTKRGENGLIPSFPAPFWNFYEWSEGNSGNLFEVGKAPFAQDFDLILNAMYVYVVELYNNMTGSSYGTASVKEAIKKELYVPERGLYKISVNNDKLFGQLGNSLAILAGLGDEKIAKLVASCEGLTPATLSMKPFVYDALLLFSDEYKQFVVYDIKTVYKAMLDYGATSFWETELGWKDFNLAGSLCHGWSAAPVYYLCLLGYAKEKE